jgi:putative transposase
VLEAYSRFVVHWDLRESMKEADIEVILERAKEKYPEQISGMTHSPYYPQSSGKAAALAQVAEGRTRSTRNTAIADGIRGNWSKHTSNITTPFRLNSAIGYVAPKDMLNGRQQEIHVERDRKLTEARQQRQIRWQQAASRGSLCVCLSR